MLSEQPTHFGFAFRPARLSCETEVECKLATSQNHTENHKDNEANIQRQIALRGLYVLQIHSALRMPGWRERKHIINTGCRQGCLVSSVSSELRLQYSDNRIRRARRKPKTPLWGVP